MLVLDIKVEFFFVVKEVINVPVADILIKSVLICIGARGVCQN